MSTWPDLLIMTTRGLLTNVGGWRVLWSPEGEVGYGVTWSEDAIYVSTLRAIYKLDLNFAVLKRLAPDSPAAVHQVLYRDGYVFATLAGRDEIYTLSTDLDVLSTCSLSGQVQDTKHINSIWIDGATAWAVFHNGTAPSQVAAFNLVGGVLSLRDTYELGASKCHNVYVDGQGIVALASHDTQVIRVLDGVATHTQIDHTACGGCPDAIRFLKGVAVYPNGYVIGASKRVARLFRGKESPWLLRLGLDLSPVDGVELPNGSVQDVRTVAADISHNGIAFPGALQ